MLRREVARRAESAPADAAARSVLFVGPTGRGVGLAADILADAARLSHRRVQRRRNVSASLGSPLSPAGTMAQLVCLSLPSARVKSAQRTIAADGSTHPAPVTVEIEPVDVVVAWDRDAANRCGSLIGPETEVIVVNDGVPQWRAGWTASNTSPRTSAACDAARALGRVSLRLPFAAELWRRTIALHVPPRFAETIVTQFDAARS